MLSDSSSDSETNVDNDRVHDARLSTLQVQSSYTQLDGIDGTADSFRRSRYVALHLNIHSLPRKYTELRNLLDSLKENGIIVHFVLLCETFPTNLMLISIQYLDITL